MWTFSSRPSQSPSHTHLTNNAQGQQQQKYKKKLLEQQQNTKIFIRRRPSHYVTLAQANYYLNLFHTILCWFILTCMHQSTIQIHLSSSQTQLGRLQFLEESQNHKRTILWSQILVTNLVTLVIPAIHFAWIPYDHAPVLRSAGSYLE